MNIVEIIKNLQLKKDGKVSLNRLEQELDIGKSTISSWATKNPTADKLKKIADYFGCSIDYLLCRTDNPFMANDAKNITLTDEERELIKTFRSLSLFGQEKMLAYARDAGIVEKYHKEMKHYGAVAADTGGPTEFVRIPDETYEQIIRKDDSKIKK